MFCDFAPLGLQLDAAPKGKERKAAQTLLETAEAKLSKYRSRLSAMHSSETVPKVEVGCLEEVISRMEADADGEWGSVMFIPAGNLPIYCMGYPWSLLLTSLHITRCYLTLLAA